MWLDRLSGHSTPSGSPPPHHRNYSPAPPRQPSRLSAAPQINRPYSPRSSSLSLSLTANNSTVSLAGRSRSPTCLSLKQDLARGLPPGTADPLDVLHGVIGKPRETGAGSNAAPEGIDDPVKLGEAIDFGGLSLKEFVAPKDKNDGTGGVQAQTVVRCSLLLRIKPRGCWIDRMTDENERNKFEDLHSAITVCASSTPHVLNCTDSNYRAATMSSSL